MPSYAEGLPVTVMEALAIGRPVVTTAIAGIPELVRTGVNGWLVPPGSVDDLVDALREALATPVGELSVMGKAGAEAVAEQHAARTEAAKLQILLAT
jgi:glycosyltransferase involved in cell wall biosynthesis